jgi:hypothetical protein
MIIGYAAWVWRIALAEQAHLDSIAPEDDPPAVDPPTVDPPAVEPSA